LPLPRVAAETRNLLLLRERSDTLVMDDPKPGLVEVARIARQVSGGILRRLTPRIPAPGFVRRRRARRLQARVRAARSVLFVCKGNICRSPFAERYARGVFPEHVRVASAGYYPVADRESPPEAVIAARSRGVDLAEHRSRLLSAQSVGDADIVFVFDEENRDRVRSEYPFARDRTFLIGTLEPSAGPVIHDPYGGTVAEFEATYRTISRLIDACGRLVAGNDIPQSM
jgi:protein-tyrosine-phosphatase